MATRQLGNKIGLSPAAITCLEKYLQDSIDKSLPRRSLLQSRLQHIDRQYLREFITEGLGAIERQRILKSVDNGDYSQVNNLIVPFVFPAVETGVSYQAAVFLSEPNIISVIPTPQLLEAGEMMNALIESYQERGKWAVHLMQCFRDGEMYNHMIASIDWETISSPSLSFTGTDSLTPKVNKDNVWSGSVVKHLDLYNTFWDPLVSLDNLCEDGEFAGYHEVISAISLRRLFKELPNFISANKQALIDSADVSGELYFAPIINANYSENAHLAGTINWSQFSGQKTKEDRKFKNAYTKTTLFARIVPKDHGITHVPDPTSVHIVRLVYINKRLASIEFRNNVHNYLPIIGCYPNQSNLNEQQKSTAENAAPFQVLSTILFGSMIAARRRAVSDRGIYDPLKIDAKQINNPNPSAKIPLRTTAFGSNPAEAYYSIPFRDEASPGLISSISQLDAIASRTLGQNPARQGQFVKGNKTTTEFNDIMQASASRDQLKALVIEHSFFSRIKYIVKNDILQYEGPLTLFSAAQEKIVNVDPTVIRNAVLAFKTSDGATPASKLMNDDAWQVAMQTISAVPQIGQEYNIGNIFSYLMHIKGAKISDFKKPPEQVQFEQQTAAWQNTVQVISELMIKAGQMPNQSNFPPQPQQPGQQNAPTPPQ